MCNADNPNCIDNVTCDNCNDGFNPHLIVASYLITNGDVPLEEGEILSTQESKKGLAFRTYPNPTSSYLNIEFNEPSKDVEVRVFNSLGQLVRVFKEDYPISVLTVNLTDLPKSIYSLEVSTSEGLGISKVIVE